MIQDQFGTKIKVLQTDNGKEYSSSILGTYLSTNGIVHHSSQNIPTKCSNKKKEQTPSRGISIFTNRVLKQFWGEAI